MNLYYFVKGLEDALIAQAGSGYPLRPHDQALLSSNLRIVSCRSEWLAYVSALLGGG